MAIEVQSDGGKLEIYPRCTRAEDAQALEDLCSKCPIPTAISLGLPRIKAEIEVHRQGNTHSGFIAYCEKALANHLEKAAHFANDLANPAKSGGLNIGKSLEIKFWNLALCDLYKAEVEPLQQTATAIAAAASADESAEYHYIRPEIKQIMNFMQEHRLHTAQMATLAAQTASANAQKERAERAEEIEAGPSLLPSKIAESHTYFTALLKTCAQLPRYDVAQTLRAAFEQYRAKGFYAWSDFVQRLPTYIAQHLSSDMQQMLNASGGLLTSFRATLRVAELRPEEWPFWGIDERPRLLIRQQDVAKRLEMAQQDGRLANVSEHTETLDHIARILAAFDAAEAVGGSVVNAPNLDSSQKHPITEQEVNQPTEKALMLSPAALRTLYLKLLEHPALLNELSTYQKAELYAYAEREKISAYRLAIDLMDGTPQYNYPTDYLNGREAEYWAEKNSAYRDSLRVLELLNKSSVHSSNAPAQAADAFWEALRSIPLEVEWVSDSPRYNVPTHLLGYEDFNDDLRSLRVEFEAALPKLKKKHLRLLRGELRELLKIDRQSFKRRGELHKEQQYALQFLPDDYPILRFKVAPPGRGLSKPWQWVNPSIWTGFVVLMQYKQEAARVAYDKISAALGESAYSTTAPVGVVPSVTPPAVNKVVFRNRFTLEDADRIAHDINLTDEAGYYSGLAGVAAGRLCGFYWQLKSEEKVSGSLELLRDYFAMRYLKRLISSKPNMNSQVAKDMAVDTSNALKKLSLTKNSG